METTFDRIPVGESSFAYQKYIARVGVLDLFCGLNVEGSGMGEAAGLVLDIPFDPAAQATVRDSLLGVSGKILGDKANAFLATAVAAAPGALTWLENLAFAELTAPGDRTLAAAVVAIVKSVWDKVKSFLATGVYGTARAGNGVLELMRDERLIMHAAVRFVARFLREQVIERVASSFNAVRVAGQLALLAGTTCHTVYHRFGPLAYAAGIPQQISSGIYLGRALCALLDGARMTNAAYQVAQSFGCFAAWPAKVAASLAHRLLTLIVRVSEHLRLGRLIGYARAYAQDHGYRGGRGNGALFKVPALDAATQKAQEAEFDRFYRRHIAWFPAAAGLCLLVPNGVGDPWSYLNLVGDDRYWSGQGGKVALDRARFAAGVKEMENLRHDARLYLNAIGLSYSHDSYDIARAMDLRAADDPSTGKGFWYYVGLMFTNSGN